MAKHRTYTETDLRYLKMLSRMFPTVRAAATEIINLNAILNLPKGCEHFISDLHGEHEAFLHILNSCSGVIREPLELAIVAGMVALHGAISFLISWEVTREQSHDQERGASEESSQDVLL